MKSTTIAILFLAISLSMAGQDGDFSLGARNSALAGASATLTDGWAIYNNMAAMAEISRPIGMLSYQNRYGLSSFQVVGAAFLQPTFGATAGISFYRFGDNLFNQQQMKLAVAHHLDRVAIGVAVNWVQVAIESLGTASTLILEFGGIATITEQLNFSAHAYNVNQTNLIGEETLPTILKAGFSYQPIASVLIVGEVQKDLGFDEIVKVGLEHEIVQNVWVRTGISTNPIKAAFGAGTHWKSWGIDYAFNDQTDLGAIHEISLSYQLKREP